MFEPAILALEDGTVFSGRSIGVSDTSVGEVVFNTAMTGYQEILTDPSYCRQLVTLTHPHIGNTGTNPEDEEATGVQVAGLIVRDIPALASNFRSEENLSSYLRRHNVVGIADIDTRKLTRILRDQGAQSGCISGGASASKERCLSMAYGFSGLKGMDLAKIVSTKTRYEWNEGVWQLSGNPLDRKQLKFSLKVVALDFGVKRNILRILVSLGCRVIVLPATSSFDEVMSESPDGIFLSNGPGDPEPCDYAIDLTRRALDARIPIFGICLGHQILALASGGRTEKMKFGHHGANHPVQNLADGTVMVTSQNHGFTVSERDLPGNLEVTHRSLFDGSLQGITRLDAPAYSFQGHPEASPGPKDAEKLFFPFLNAMRQSQGC